VRQHLLTAPIPIAKLELVVVVTPGLLSLVALALLLTTVKLSVVAILTMDLLLVPKSAPIATLAPAPVVVL